VPIFFFNDTATTEIYTLSLHDALPISPVTSKGAQLELNQNVPEQELNLVERSEEHTSELQSLTKNVCLLLLEKHKKRHRHGYPRGAHNACKEPWLSRHLA